MLLLVLPEHWQTYIPGTLSWPAQSLSEYLPSQEVRIPGQVVQVGKTRTNSLVGAECFREY